jgi:predicted hydrocarbon binding protein
MAENKAVVKTPGDCIECMSCQYICPANCITQNNLQYSKNFYRDLDVFESATKYLFPVQDTMEITPEDFKRANDDLLVRLSSIGTTFKKMVGASAPTVATTAGRGAALHLPEMYSDKYNTLKALLENLKERFKHAWDLNITMKSDTEAEVVIKACNVREICNKANLQIGGDLCDLFKSYLNGILVEILKKRPQIKIESTSQEQCKYIIKVME